MIEIPFTSKINEEKNLSVEIFNNLNVKGSKSRKLRGTILSSFTHFLLHASVCTITLQNRIAQIYIPGFGTDPRDSETTILRTSCINNMNNNFTELSSAFSLNREWKAEEKFKNYIRLYSINVVRINLFSFFFYFVSFRPSLHSFCFNSTNLVLILIDTNIKVKVSINISNSRQRS